VVLEFRGPSWIDVRDSAKSFSLMGEMAKGDRRVLGGTPPYSLILGNASSVTVTVNGAPFDLTRVAKGNVARFKLNPADVNQVRQDAGATPPLSGRERGPGEARDLP
jgi:cytoskeleton protein RodZ